MARDLWLPEAIKVPGNNGLRQGAGGGRGLCFFTWHTFEAPYTYSPDGVAAMRYLHSRGSTAHFTFHPVTGAIVQGLPADQAARTLRATTAPGQDVNRYGDVHMQVEVIAYARRPFTLDLTSAGLDGLTRLMNFLRAWGIPDQWAWPDVTRPPATYAEANAPGHRRLPPRSGHAYHAGWPVNDHWDPGAITAPWTLVGTPTRPSVPQPPRRDTWPAGWVSHAQELLAALGYYTGEVDDSAGPLTEAATTAYQADHGLEPDGKPGALTTAHLEDTMSTLPDQVAAAVWGQLLARPGESDPTVRADTLLRYAANRAQAQAALDLLTQLASREGVDPEAVGRAIADSLREDVVAAVREAGSLADPEAVVDALAARLTPTPAPEQEQP